MLKKAFSIVVTASFLVNSVAFALTPESRLAPVSNPQYLDIAKLTAEAVRLGEKIANGVRAELFRLPTAQDVKASAPAAAATPVAPTGQEYWPGIRPLQYVGPLGTSKLGYQWFDPKGKLDGVPMNEKLHFSLAWWHAMKGVGADIFGWGTKKLPWLQNPDPIQRDKDTIDAAFELMQKMGIEYYAFHDRDVACEITKPNGDIDVERTNEHLRNMVACLEQKQKETGIKLLWGTANLFSHPRYMNGAATNPDLHVLLHAAAQVKEALEATHKLGGKLYTLWGGREGYYSLINTATDKELDNLAQFLRMVRDHARKIGFKGKLMIEPKKREPTGHQYDAEAAAVLAFLRKYGLENDFYLNIEQNHAMLAGNTFQHELQVAADSGKFASIDANSGKMPGAPDVGWDTDHFPGLEEALEAMLVINKIGGFKEGGVHFDAKTHRTSTDPEDIFIAHALGMDSYVLAHIISRSYLADPEVQEFLRNRYASYNTELGKRFREGKLTLEDAAKLAAEIGEPKQTSGKLEFLQRKLQQHKILAPVMYLVEQSAAGNEFTHNAIDKVTVETAPADLVRPGDEIVFDHRRKVVDGDTAFVPCWIKGVLLGEKAVTTRHYLCVAKKTAGGKYDYEFIPDGSKDLGNKSVAEAIKDVAIRTALAKSSRPADVKAGVARFVKQQSADEIIAKAIKNKTAVVLRPLSARYALVVFELLDSHKFKVAESFGSLVSSGQLMDIPGIDKPHAGGIGIYLPMGREEYHNAETLFHEIFAKCGFSDEDAGKMFAICTKLVDGIPLTADESALFERAKNADFMNRYDDVLNMDFNRLTIDKMPQALIKRYRGSGKHWYVGIDSSTQAVKFNVISADTGETIWQWVETFSEKHYKGYKAPSGWLVEPLKEHPDAAYYTDPRMTADALDRGMAAIASCFVKYGWDIKNIRRISGAGQQHGLVFLNDNGEGILRNLDPKIPVPQQIAPGLAWEMATIWKNKMTSRQQIEINRFFGGADSTRRLTGSSAELRFGLPQILWLYQNHPEIYAKVRKIINIAGFNGALLTGNAVFDDGDAAGTNAVDIRTGKWLSEIDKLVPGLTSYLAPIRRTGETIGKLSPYWVKKYGFSENVEVVNFTGDNPSQMTGQGIVKPGMTAISLGTSFTIYSYVDKAGLDQALATPIGNVFREPTNGEWMKLICFQNGAEALKRIRDEKIEDDEAIGRLAAAGIMRKNFKTGDEWEKAIDNMKWDIFNELVSSVSQENFDAVMVTQVEDETAIHVPYIEGRPWTRNFDYYGSDRATVLRAAMEGQIFFLKYAAEDGGLDVKQINLVAGASKNPVIRQAIANIFNVPIDVLQGGEYFPTEACALGAAIRAAESDESIVGSLSKLTAVDKNKTAMPRLNAVRSYMKRYEEYKKLLAEAIYAGRVKDAAVFHKESFGKEAEALAAGPGRLNLLGEHIDYAGGLVLPIALDGVDIIAAVSKRNDGMIVINSPRFGEYKISAAELRKIAASKEAGLAAIPEEFEWARYPLGVVRQLMELPGVGITGFNISYDGNVPLGGGLSSSAAVETAVFTALEGILKTGLDKKAASKLCQAAEHWRGNPCGIMDQYASFNGEKGKAVLLNCNTLESKAIDIGFLDVAGYAIVAADTGLPKTKEAWTRYTARRAALEEAVAKYLSRRFPAIKTILDIAPNLTTEMFEKIKSELEAATSAEVQERVAHVVFEQERVVRMLVPIAEAANELAAAVVAGDETKRPLLEAEVRKFGYVLFLGHQSMDVLYDMSSPELNKLVESAMSHGSVGSRLTGAGIVGCTVNIVKKEDITRFRKGVSAEYRAAFGTEPLITVTRAGAGAHVIDAAAMLSPAAKAAQAATMAMGEGDKTRGAEGIAAELYARSQMIEGLKNAAEGARARRLTAEFSAPLRGLAARLKRPDADLARTASDLSKLMGNIRKLFLRKALNDTHQELLRVLLKLLAGIHAKMDREVSRKTGGNITPDALLTRYPELRNIGKLSLPYFLPYLETILSKDFMGDIGRRISIVHDELIKIEFTDDSIFSPMVAELSIDKTGPEPKVSVQCGYQKEYRGGLYYTHRNWLIGPLDAARFVCDIFRTARLYRQSSSQGAVATVAMGEGDEEAAPQLPAGIDETLLDLTNQDVNSGRTVFFVAQEFASLERCKELFPNATFVPFSQRTQFDGLPEMLDDARYAGAKKVLVTLGLNADERVREIILYHERSFLDVVPLNIKADCFSGLTTLEQKPFQKGILTMGLLASAIPADKSTYKETRSYMILRTLLNMIFEDEAVTNEYIDKLVNPGHEINVSARWGYLIGRMIGPVKQRVINVYTRIVSYFA